MATVDGERERCGAPTRTGAPCRNWAVEDGRCRLHARRAAQDAAETADPDGDASGAPGDRADEPDTPGDDGDTGRAGDGDAPTLTTFTAGATGRRRHAGGTGQDGFDRTFRRPERSEVEEHLHGSGSSGGPRGGPGAGPSWSRGQPPLAEFVDALADVLGDGLADHLDGIAAAAGRRLTGDYGVDDFGLDPDLLVHVIQPLLRPLYDTWWRVTSNDREHLPDDSGALLVANHAGTLPFDGMMLSYDVHDATGRFLRELGADLVFELPIVGHVARKAGAVRASQTDAQAVLARHELAAVFPEGFKGLGKPFSQRYQLERFGRGGFVSTALRAGVPIIPVAIVGSEEIYPMLFDAKVVARALGLPYFPIVAQMLALPVVGPLGLVPLPSKWSITYGEPIHTDEMPTSAADDPMAVFDLADQVRGTIQDMLTQQLMGRRSVFF